MIQVKRIGHILYVKNYKQCIRFYETILELAILFQNSTLTCFEFYGAYLMIEKEDREAYLNTTCNNKSFSCIRMNVSNIKEVSQNLQEKNIIVDYNEFDWGVTAKFYDPDGNLIALKDEEGFLKQIERGFYYLNQYL